VTGSTGSTQGGVPRRDVAVEPSGPAGGSIVAPASKSVTNRLLVIAALADGRSTLRRPLESDDSAVMRGVVEGLGAAVTAEGDVWDVAGTGGALRSPEEPLDAGLSGTTMRFGAALAALAPGPVTLTGKPPLLARPIGALTEALRTLGGKVTDREGFPPVSTHGGGLRGGTVTVDVEGSSQFASALLLVAPYAAEDVEVVTSGGSAADYIALTVDVMRAWGAEVADLGPGRWRVTARTGYRPRDVDVEHDASAAAHLYGIAAATGGTVTVANAGEPTRQPDAALPSVLADMGCEVRRDAGGVTVTGPERLRPVRVDLSSMPDQVTTVAALAALADGVSDIGGVAVARRHETDRLAALAAELGKLGIEVVERPDGLRIAGGDPSGPARLHTYDDHRLAMAFTAVAARVPGTVIAEPWCVTKTYPLFWTDVATLGIVWREVTA
jgi:3-phosphoshikimate 1-carboxyvinyltransferase